MNMDYPSRNNDQNLEQQDNPRKQVDIMEILKQCGIDPSHWESLVLPEKDS
ncbi:hypothetical protein QPK24_05110 [Paenibacillus polygoni]|uniref:Uncharacterized protein n=1 Tax=Paenibacillus polygoni TaxID=3050112 RepID=A0ABY8X5Y2_9BACL|nr:hypothetical protein [Paenibacillus polygoni]WIV20099.1 hypothetical protein QPK24_05110 [Paenibacillus polygoni]